MQAKDALVLAYLKAGNELSDLKAVRLWEYSNLRNSISRLRAMGYNITSRWESSQGKARYKVYFLSDIKHIKRIEDEREKLSYWEQFFGQMEDTFLRKECAAAMHKIYLDTDKDYKEIWPEPGNSTFQPIYEKYGYQWSAPKKASA